MQLCMRCACSAYAWVPILRWFLLTTCYLLLATCYLLLATCYLLLAACYLLLATSYLLLATCDLLLATCYLLLATCYLLLATCYLLLATCYSLLATHYSLLATHYSLLTSLLLTTGYYKPLLSNRGYNKYPSILCQPTDAEVVLRIRRAGDDDEGLKVSITARSMRVT